MAGLLTLPFFDVGAGITPADGALLHFNVVGSETDKDTYTTSAATTPHANPVVADSKGVFPAIYLVGDYDWVLTDKNLVQINTGSVSELVTGSGQSVNVLARDTLNDAVIDTSLQAGLQINIAERTTGNGGGAMWDVVLSSTVTENTYNIVQCTGVGTLSLVLRIGAVLESNQIGCTGDGVTDDGPAYRAGLEALKLLNGGEFIFSPSANGYVLGAVRVDDVNNITINGNGQTVLADDPALNPTGRSVIHFNRCDNVLVHNLTIDGRFSAWVHSGLDQSNHNISWNDGNNITVRDCVLKNAGYPNTSSTDKQGDAVYMQADQSNILIEDNTFLDVGRWGVVLEFSTTDVDNVRVLDNTLLTTDASNTSALGFLDFEFMSSTANTVMSNTVISGNTANYNAYVALSNCTHKNLTIRDNFLSGKATDGSIKQTSFPYGIFVTNLVSNPAHENIKIMDNTLHALAGPNIKLDRANIDTVITDNIIRDDTVSANGSFNEAINLLLCENITVKDNEIKGRHFATATLITITTDSGTVSGNTVYHGTSPNPCINMAPSTSTTGETIYVKNNDMENNSTNNVCLIRKGCVFTGNSGRSKLNEGYAQVDTDVKYIGQNDLKFSIAGGGDAQQDTMVKQLVDNDNNIVWLTSSPTKGTWNQGDIILNKVAAASGQIGWVPVVAGTLGTLNSGSTTGGITTGTNALVVNDATDLKIGQYIAIAGVTGTKRIRMISGLNITLTSNADATVAAAAVSYVTPAFKTWGTITA